MKGFHGNFILYITVCSVSVCLFLCIVLSIIVLFTAFVLRWVVWICIFVTLWTLGTKGRISWSVLTWTIIIKGVLRKEELIWSHWCFIAWGGAKLKNVTQTVKTEMHCGQWMWGDLFQQMHKCKGGWVRRKRAQNNVMDLSSMLLLCKKCGRGVAEEPPTTQNVTLKLMWGFSPNLLFIFLRTSLEYMLLYTVHLVDPVKL